MVTIFFRVTVLGTSALHSRLVNEISWCIVFTGRGHTEESLFASDHFNRFAPGLHRK
jgi:hypothetical protein